VVDNSASMERFREDVAKTVWVLAKFLKLKLQPPVEKQVMLSMVTASSRGPTRVYPLTRSAAFANAVRNAQYNYSGSSVLDSW